MKRIITVIGARPQFIKASEVSKTIRQSSGLQETIVHTGQHFDANMSDVFFAELGMRSPAHHLGISGGPHGEMTGRMLGSIEEILLAEKPDAVLVYGDTNSTLAGALAAAKLHIPVAHVEAGLRSFNSRMPEEINRILADRLSQWLFTPTETASKHLRAEGIPEDRIVEVGDVMYDVALAHSGKAHADDRVLKKLNMSPNSYVLVTAHRAENTDHPCRLAVIVEAIKKVAECLPVIWPIHPRTRHTLDRNGSLPIGVPHLHLIEPVGYFDMVQLEKYAAVIATDSGGVQKEAFFHEVPCVTLREETEWVELLEAGWNRLAPPCDAKSVAKTIISTAKTRGMSITPYGKGNAASLIVEAMEKTLY